MKKILIASFCLALTATVAQAQTTKSGNMKGDEAMAQRDAKTEKGEHHGKNGMKHHKDHKMEKSENGRMDSKKGDMKGSNTNMSTTPTR